MNLRLTYEEAQPDAALRPWIRTYYRLSSGFHVPPRHEGLLVPDGHLELSFNLGGDRFDHAGGGWHLRPRACVDDVLERARLIRWEGPIRFIAVKFRFEAGLDLLDLDPRDVLRAPVDLNLLPRREIGMIHDRVRGADSWGSVVAALDAFFLARLPSGAPDPLVAWTGKALRSSAGSAAIRDLARRIGVSRRTLELRVKARTGLTPKRIAQCVRTREAIRQVSVAPDRSLSGLTAALGYCDQSHFIREFRGVTGLPPGRFFAGRQFVSDLCDA